jgi:hypothetical protein
MDHAPRAVPDAAQADHPSDDDRPNVRKQEAALYCPTCALEVSDPLICGDCSAVICRHCGTPLESSDELGMG